MCKMAETCRTEDDLVKTGWGHLAEEEEKEDTFTDLTPGNIKQLTDNETRQSLPPNTWHDVH